MCSSRQSIETSLDLLRGTAVVPYGFHPRGPPPAAECRFATAGGESVADERVAPLVGGEIVAPAEEA